MDWRPLVVVALVCLAGCGTLIGDDADSGETLTPAPVPSVTPTDTTERVLPPGVSGGGRLDLDELAAAHRDALANRSYVWREWRGSHDPGVTETDDLLLVRSARVAAEDRYRYWADSYLVDLGMRTRFVHNYSEYVTGGVGYARLSPSGAEPVEVRRLPAPSASDRVGDETAPAIRRYLSLPAEDVTVTVLRRGDPARYRIDGHTATVPGANPVRNYSVTAVVSADGLLRSLSVSYRTDRPDGPTVVRYRFELSELGGTTVGPPDWYDPDGRVP
ncbi:hypothetical protein [Halosimplex salinum]|uniref:hypothetical protein n=1 Tax=Halosimplex salinum TaxID=1710538 RepID=UPI000F48BDD5|nr:hypothetical protein [Halosimplex salinum]